MNLISDVSEGECCPYAIVVMVIGTLKRTSISSPCLRRGLVLKLQSPLVDFRQLLLRRAQLCTYVAVDCGSGPEWESYASELESEDNDDDDGDEREPAVGFPCQRPVPPYVGLDPLEIGSVSLQGDDRQGSTSLSHMWDGKSLVSGHMAPLRIDLHRASTTAISNVLLKFQTCQNISDTDPGSASIRIPVS